VRCIHQIFLCLILWGSITLPYLPTFSGQFILDDHPLVNNNPYIKKFQPFLSYFSQEDGVSTHNERGDYHSGYYRPIVNLTYFLDYTLWGMSAPGFRTTNLVLHLMTCFLLYKILSRYLKGVMAPFIAILLFGIHPVNSEAVSWTTARNSILVSLFSLASFYFYTSQRPEKRILVIFISLLFFTLALLSKEFAVMLLPIFFLYNRTITDRELHGRREWIGYIPYLVILVFYLIVRWMVTQSVLSPGGLGSVWGRIYFAPYLIVYNLKLILVPYGLHSFSVSYPETLFTWKAVVGFVGVAFFGLFLMAHRRDKLILFSSVSFILGLLPILNIVKISAVTLISMRWLYFPMVFLLLGLSKYIQNLMKINQPLKVSIIGAVIMYCGTYTYILNKDLWHNEGVFFRQEVINFNNVYYAGGLAGDLLDNKQYREAEHYFKIAIDHYPNEARDYINYSALLIETGRPREALSYLEKASSLIMNPRERGEWFNNMGMSYFRLKQLDSALRYFIQAVTSYPNEPDFWKNLGGNYGSMGDYRNSVLAFQRGLEISPDSLPLRKNLAITYLKMKDYEKARVTLEKIPSPLRDREVDALLRKAEEHLLIKCY
jgi:tetratricopeptide (TPR) repeat protein